MPSQYSQKYVIVHFIGIENTPSSFPATEWPLHITLLANFQIASVDRLKDQLEEYSMHNHAFDVHTSGEAMFGPQQNVRVSLIEPNQAILSAHSNLLQIVSAQNAVFDELAFTGAGYRPHATVQLTNRLQDGQEVTIDSLSLVDMFPDQDYRQRKIINTYKLHQ